jgi:hypothetical protein
MKENQNQAIDRPLVPTARALLERRLFALGVPIMAAPIREAIDALESAARKEGRRQARRA